jgi:hypothetical protein
MDGKSKRLPGSLVKPTMLLLAGMLWFCLAWTAWAAPTFAARLDRDTIVLGERATLSLVFQDGKPNGVPNVASPANLSIQYAGESTQVNLINGQLSTSLVYNYVLTPQQVGEYQLPALRVQVGNQVLSSPPVKLRVLAGGGGDTNISALSQLAFLKLIVSKGEVYLGEVLPVEIRLYCQDAQNLQIPQLLAEGFTVGKIAQPIRTQSQVTNRLYNLLIFKTFVAAAKSGNLTLGPAQCSLVLRIPKAGRRRLDPFDMFGSDPFEEFFGPRAELRQVTLTSQAQAVRVLPLPSQNAPANFNGAVGQFNLAVHASPTNLAVGDPVTVRVQIAGRGTLDTLTLPALNDWEKFKTYPPSSRIETSDPVGIAGVKEFEFVAVPQTAEVKALPAIAFSFFDPEQKSYRLLQQPAIPLVVYPTVVAAAPPSSAAVGGSERESSAPAQDIANIKARLGMVAELGPPLALRPWFLALQTVPVLLWLGTVIWRQYTEKLQQHPRLRRQRRVARLVQRGLKELRHHAQANQAEAFYATAFRLLQEQLGERLDLPASAITEAVLEEHLRPRGVPEETLALVHEVFHRCNQARYAPPQANHGLQLELPKVQSALWELREI